MGIDIQINPTSPVHSIGFELGELLADHGVDFNIRYMAIERTPEIISKIEAVQPRDEFETIAILKLLLELERVGSVELFLSF